MYSKMKNNRIQYICIHIYLIISFHCISMFLICLLKYLTYQFISHQPKQLFAHIFKFNLSIPDYV
jgi:hypothetical protein